MWQDVNQNGVSEAGRTTATATDGTQVLVSDAGFEFSSLADSSDTVMWPRWT